MQVEAYVGRSLAAIGGFSRVWRGQSGHGERQLGGGQWHPVPASAMSGSDLASPGTHILRRTDLAAILDLRLRLFHVHWQA
jgi:hypothetical protein